MYFWRVIASVCVLDCVYAICYACYHMVVHDWKDEIGCFVQIAIVMFLYAKSHMYVV